MRNIAETVLMGARQSTDTNSHWQGLKESESVAMPSRLHPKSPKGVQLGKAQTSRVTSGRRSTSLPPSDVMNNWKRYVSFVNIGTLCGRENTVFFPGFTWAPKTTAYPPFVWVWSKQEKKSLPALLESRYHPTVPAARHVEALSLEREVTNPPPKLASKFSSRMGASRGAKIAQSGSMQKIKLK